jgi:DNA mismatch repair protein MutS2
MDTAPPSSRASSIDSKSVDFSINPLEYDRLKDLVARYTSTDAARKLLADLKPATDEALLQDEHEITAEAMAYLRELRVPFNDIALLPEALHKLTVTGSMLEIPEIEAVESFLNQVEGLRIRWKDDRAKFPRLASTGHRLPDLRDLNKRLSRAVRNGEINENYSPELARIRRALNVTRSRLTDRLESMVKSPALAGQLQDQLITIRNGRFVIPVRSDQRKAVEGIVHGSSSSGATVFMEPLAALELNNELVRLQEQERFEIARILAELTDLIQASAEAIRQAQRIAAYLEVVFAKARFGRDFDCGQPRLSKGSLLSLVRARHPLLEDNLRRENVAISPVSLDLDATRRVLVISGPNAGGKTVVLKTVGLLALMAQSGIPIPAEEAELPLFDRILADIGDQQSITNHLSTFSAHVLAVRAMIESATPRSLILLDEIGSSTEPGEGAALARAVLETFREIGALTVATTHYNRLKFYAETTSGVANAAMEFNELTLQPTYRLIHGLSGASSGLKIAERLRMPANVIIAANSFLDAGDIEAAHYVDELRRRIADLESEKARFEKERHEFEEWRKKEFESLSEQQKEEIARVEKRLERIVQELSERAEHELESAGQESVRKFQKKLANAKAHAASEIRRERQQVDAPTPSAPEQMASRLPVVEGSLVRIVSMGVTGSVTSRMDGDIEVLIGNIKLRRPESDLEVVVKEPVRLPKNVQLQISSKPLEKNELNIVGRKVDEALDLTDKFLDDAFLAQMTEVRIVHGSGTGALRQAVSEFLSGHPHVSHFEFAPQNQGGRGVTVVRLKD